MTDKVEILDEGIRVHLGEKNSGYWVLFGKDWDNIEIREFRDLKDDLDALKLLIQKAVDWAVPDKTWNLIPFDKANLVAQIESFQKGEAKDIFRLPAQMPLALSSAYYDAYIASMKLPFGKRSAS